MKLLIDTQILIWFLEGNNLLSTQRRQIIADPDTQVMVSIASIWEMAIKISLGKLSLSNPLADVVEQIHADNIELLSISSEHALKVEDMPFHHRDPFDRIIIAQAMVENLKLMGEDAVFAKYEVSLV